MKVLISAYSCLPGRGSEPGAGWAWTYAATRDHDVWLMTHSANAIVLELMRASDERLARRLHPVYLHIGRWAEPLRRGGPLRFVYYIAWQLVTCRWAARKLHASVGFDVCHHVTYASDWLPAGVSTIPGLPFVWGPVGGSSTTVGPRVWALLGCRAFISELTRAVVLAVFRLTVGRRLSRRAAVVLGQNADVANAFAPTPVTIQPHVALEVGRPHTPRWTNLAASPVAVYAGRLLGWKGLRLALAALRRPEASAWRLDLYGDGPERGRLERLTARWEITDRVSFFGSRPRTEVGLALSRADVLLFPSIHDAAGWSVAEAIAAGCPVLCLDSGGPATLVGATDGILVDPTGDVVTNLAVALDQARGLQPRRDQWLADRLPDFISKIYGRARNTDRCGDAGRVAA